MTRQDSLGDAQQRPTVIYFEITRIAQMSPSSWPCFLCLSCFTLPKTSVSQSLYSTQVWIQRDSHDYGSEFRDNCDLQAGCKLKYSQVLTSDGCGPAVVTPMARPEDDCFKVYAGVDLSVTETLNRLNSILKVSQGGRPLSVPQRPARAILSDIT